jgi:hypothetical protein
MKLLARQRDAQLVGEEAIIARPPCFAFAFRYQPEVHVTDGAIHNLRLNHCFCHIALAALALKLIHYAGHDANRPGTFLNVGTIEAQQLAAELPENSPLFL